MHENMYLNEGKELCQGCVASVYFWSLPTVRELRREHVYVFSKKGRHITKKIL